MIAYTTRRRLPGWLSARYPAVLLSAMARSQAVRRKLTRRYDGWASLSWMPHHPTYLGNGSGGRHWLGTFRRLQTTTDTSPQDCSGSSGHMAALRVYGSMS